MGNRELASNSDDEKKFKEAKEAASKKIMAGDIKLVDENRQTPL